MTGTWVAARLTVIVLFLIYESCETIHIGMWLKSAIVAEFSLQFFVSVTIHMVIDGQISGHSSRRSLEGFKSKHFFFYSELNNQNDYKL